MSINGAVAELDKEIAALTKEIGRLTQIRNSLSQGATKSATPGSAAASVVPAKKSGPRKRPGPKKSATVKKSVPAKASAPPAKRVVSAATRKKMSDAAKARVAKKETAAK